MGLHYRVINHPKRDGAESGELVQFLGAGGELDIGLLLGGDISQGIEVFDAPEVVGAGQ